MGAGQLLEYATDPDDGLGKLGMYLAAGDNLKTSSNQYRETTPTRLGRCQGAGHTQWRRTGSVQRQASPRKIKAGLRWLAFKVRHPDRIGRQPVRHRHRTGRPAERTSGPATPPRPERGRRPSRQCAGGNFKPFAEAKVSLKTRAAERAQIYAV